MLRFFEPEMETSRPFSAAPADFQPFPVLQFPSWGMQQNPVSTASLLTSVFVGNDESRATSSNAAAEVDRFFDGGVFINAENCESFGAFSPPPPPHVSTNPLNCITAGMAPKPTSSRTPGKASVQHNIKTLAVADTAMENETMKREAKRRKTTPCLENPQILQSDEPAASQTPVKRSQKLGDKITALQQLVSPFGKTDTASVLHEATIYIKILHEQIQMLSNPYFGIKSPAILQGHGGDRLGLSQRGLCLSPISSTIINLINQTPLNASLQH